MEGFPRAAALEGAHRAPYVVGLATALKEELEITPFAALATVPGCPLFLQAIRNLPNKAILTEADINLLYSAYTIIRALQRGPPSERAVQPRTNHHPPRTAEEVVSMVESTHVPEERLGRWQSVETHLESVADFTTVDSKEDLLTKLKLLPKEGPPQNLPVNLVNAWKGRLLYVAEQHLYRKVGETAREHGSRTEFWLDMHDCKKLSTVDCYQNLFILSFNHPRYKYFTGFSLLKQATRLVAHFTRGASNWVLSHKACGAPPPPPFNPAPTLVVPETPKAVKDFVRIGSSRVHGLGLFAAKNYTKGTQVLQLQGKWLDDLGLIEKYPFGTKPKYVVSSQVAAGKHLEVTNAGKWVNMPPTGWDPNTELVECDTAQGCNTGTTLPKLRNKRTTTKVARVEVAVSIALVATKDIQAGEELYCLY
jgi:hypothetical protein